MLQAGRFVFAPRYYVSYAIIISFVSRQPKQFCRRFSSIGARTLTSYIIKVLIYQLGIYNIIHVDYLKYLYKAYA